MRILLFAFLTICSLNLFFAGCKKNIDCDDCGHTWERDTSYNYVDSLVIARPLKVGVRAYTRFGEFIPNALVIIALSSDSAKQQKYFLTDTTDATGHVLITGLLAWRKGSNSKYYYLNAEGVYAGDSLNSVNANNNSPVWVILDAHDTTFVNIVVSAK